MMKALKTDSINIKQRAYYKKNKKKIAKRIKNRGYVSQTNYRNKNKDLINKKKKSYAETNPVKNILLKARKRAKEKGLEFNLTDEDIIIPEYCPLLKVKLTNIHGQGKVLSNISLDRIDNTLGYIKGNVQVVSCLANVMKNSATKEQLLQFAKSIIEYYDE